MTHENLHNKHDAMEGWQAQFDEAKKHAGWKLSDRDHKQQILLEIMKRSRKANPNRHIPDDDAQARDLAERVIRHYEGPA